MKLFKKILCIVIASILLSTNTIMVFANDNKPVTSVLDMEKENFIYLEGEVGDTRLVYTYTSDNKLYKVIENASDNFDLVNSVIYVDQGDDNFVKYATQTLVMKDGIITITINENGVSSKEQIDTNPRMRTINPALANQKSTNAISYISPFANLPVDGGGGDSWNGMPVSAWIYYGTYRNSTKIAHYTVTAVTQVLAALSGYLGVPGAVVVSAITGVVSEIVKDNIPHIWWTDSVYHKTCIPPDPNMFRKFVAERTYRDVYSNSARTDLIGTYYYSYYDSLYVSY